MRPRLRGCRPVLRVLLLLALLFPACTPRPSPLERLARFTGAGHSAFQIEYSEPDEELIPEVTAALQRASELIDRWGGLSHPVVVRIHADHDGLEQAIGRQGFPWLRAWAQYLTVHLQSPRTWGIPWKSQLEELLAHEMTHVAMYQAISGPHDWDKRYVPLWFREGMASVSAGQGYRRGSEAEISAQLRQMPLDPFSGNEEVLRLHKDLVYDSSHWAFRFLLELHGTEEDGTARVRTLLEQMRRGASFPSAFRTIWGMEEAEFLQRWLRHIGVAPPSV